MALKSKINITLPIALAIILPGLGLYSNSEMKFLTNLGFIEIWAIISILLYLLWHLLWYLWDIKSGYKKLWIVLVPIVFIGVIYGVLYLFAPHNLARIGNNGFFNGIFLVRTILVMILFSSIQYALKAQQNISNLLLEKEQLQTENYKAQLKAIRAQIDPHFLFNSLNTLRSMVRQQHRNSEKFIMSLSDFYRKTLKHNENTTLQLSDELVVLKSYLFLMKSRNEEAVSVCYDINESLNQLHLPTLALQVVVENCFKHNSMTSKIPLKIEIFSTDDGYIEVRNNIQPKIGDIASNGFGLEMLRKRYQLMNIPNGVMVENTSDQFSVKLKLI